jgi:serine/threonine protein phosphatase 1
VRTLAIGDIHGCYNALTSLLEVVGPVPKDQFIFLGDYVDRGENSREVIELLLSDRIQGRKSFLRGNHEVMMLNSKMDPIDAHNWQGCGGFETLLSYGAKTATAWATAIPAAHWDFLERTKSWFETEKNIFVHGGAASDCDMAEQRDFVLFWSRFEHIKPHRSGKKIICGHTPQPGGEIADNGFATCIDTGAVFGGWLSCLDVDTGDYWQANEERATRKGRLGDFGMAGLS